MRTLLFLALVGGLAWLAFTVQVGGETLATHFGDIWRSDVVQDKVTLVKDGVELELSQKLAQRAEEQMARHQGEAQKRLPAPQPKEELTQADRAALEKLLH